MNAAKCKGAQRWIKPFRCLEGPFQSDALLVPEGCLFDHIHNASRCWPFVRWNQTGAAACQDRNMQMRSFAMLLPCGISLFSGVEFVCCPKHFKDHGPSNYFLSWCYPAASGFANRISPDQLPDY
uniref:E1 domain-containing protein n=1 Tax=Anopheles culicifacies TaxID=139723 RepID=A0A182M927_9DIPT